MELFCLGIVFLVITTFRYLRRLFGVRDVAGGIHPEITLPHRKSVELFHNATSSCSQKVRTCLYEAGVDFESHLVSLPSSGSYETKMPWFLRINPAGTVPVLIHDGHPVYESHEQIVYIDDILRKDGVPSLRPTDLENLEIMNKWVDCCSVIRSEIFGDDEKAFKKRIGNVLPAMTIPVFAANLIHFATARQVFTSLLMLPFVQERSFPLLAVAFKIFGLNLLKFPAVGRKADLALPSIIYHLCQLEADLVQGGGPWICGETFSLADISWIPILERMEVARFWSCFHDDDYGSFEKVRDYWKMIQERPSYKKGRAANIDDKIAKIKSIIDGWKKQHPWFSKRIYNEDVV